MISLSDSGYLVRQFFKALFVGGIAYYTYKEGIWGNAFSSSCFLGKFLESCPPEEEDLLIKNDFADLRTITLSDPEPCMPFIPSTAYGFYRLGCIWNKIVIFTIWLLIDGPREFLMFLLSLFEKKPKPKVVPLCKK